MLEHGRDDVTNDGGVLAPAVAPAILAVGDGRDTVLYVVAGACALSGAVAVVPVKRVR